MNTIKIPYNSSLIFVSEDGEQIVLNSKVQDWLNERNIMIGYNWTWNYGWREPGPGHLELYFTSESDLICFSLRWL